MVILALILTTYCNLDASRYDRTPLGDSETTENAQNNFWVTYIHTQAYQDGRAHLCSTPSSLLFKMTVLLCVSASKDRGDEGDRLVVRKTFKCFLFDSLASFSSDDE